MTWALFGRALRLAFYLRVPLLTLLLVAALGPISLWSGAHSLLGNLFDQQNDDLNFGWNIFTVSFAAFLLAFTAVTTLNLTLHYGTERFSDDAAVSSGGASAGKSFQLDQARPGLTFVCGLIAATILIATVIVRTEGGWLFLKIALAVCAFLCAMGATLVAKIVQLALTNPEVTRHPPPYLVFPAYRWGWLQNQLNQLYCWPAKESQWFLARFVRNFKAGGGRWMQWPLRTFKDAGQGYLQGPDNGCLYIRSGHVFGATLAALAFVTYLGLSWGKQQIVAEPALISGLAFLLLFLLVACWALSALCFFLDRYRFPLLLSIVLLARLTSSAPESDHFFRIETEDSVRRLSQKELYATPAEYLRERFKNKEHERLIVVATPGGGIQAAAWTATVLAGLDKGLNGGKAGEHTFHNSVGMISSVSGGSLGAIIYAASFAGTISPDCVAENAKRSAIDEVAWGWTSPDFWRTLLPWFRGDLAVDRGWALEQKWAVINGLSPNRFSHRLETSGQCAATPLKHGPDEREAEKDTYLSDWAKLGTKIPALILNSTIVESGQHVVFATTQYPMKDDSRGSKDFYNVYPDERKKFDIRVNTAARLSASFPYVAPAARSIGLDNLYSPDFHFVDGGYYDNLGVDSVIGWLHSAFDGSNRAPVPGDGEILLVQIRHFNASPDPPGSRDGWGFQLLAPPSGLLNMWSYAPAYRDRNELAEFTKNLERDKGPTVRSVFIPYCGSDYNQDPKTVAADYQKCIRATDESLKDFIIPKTRPDMKVPKTDCANPPLSWKLSETQKTCISEAWQDFVQNDPTEAIAKIRMFLSK